MSKRWQMQLIRDQYSVPDQSSYYEQHTARAFQPCPCHQHPIEKRWLIFNMRKIYIFFILNWKTQWVFLHSQCNSKSNYRKCSICLVIWRTIRSRSDSYVFKVYCFKDGKEIDTGALRSRSPNPALNPRYAHWNEHTGYIWRVSVCVSVCVDTFR